MSPTRGLLETETQQKNKVSEAREPHFMIQPLSVKGNDCWTLVSIIHNTERPEVLYCMKTTAST